MNRIDTLVDCPGLVRGSQGYTFTETHEVKGVKVRLVVYRDAYTTQNRFYAEVWSPATLSWNRAVTREPNQFDLPSHITTNNDQIVNAVDEVLDDLYGYVFTLLG